MERGKNGVDKGTPEFLRDVEDLPEDAEVVSRLQIVQEGLTFDDVSIRDEHSEVRYEHLDASTRLTRNIDLRVPFVSAAMDTVTEHEMAIALAREGGIGIIHKNLSIEDQVREVERVKRAESALISDPKTLPSEARIRDVRRIKDEEDVGSILIVEGARLVGAVTKRQLRFDPPEDTAVKEIMRPVAQLKTVPEGTSHEEAEAVFRQEEDTDILPVVNEQGELKGLFTYKDVYLRTLFPLATKDEQKRLRVGAAIGVEADLNLALERIEALEAAGVDLIEINAALGQDEEVIRLTRAGKKHFPRPDFFPGNVGGRSGTRRLIEAGADGVQVGLGPGASCTTRKVTGTGVSQLSAIILASTEARGEVPINGDGGMRFSGDAVKAIVGGAETITMGRIFAGADESPGEIITLNGQPYKAYRGMGSEGAIKDGKGGRYFPGMQRGQKRTIVAEGVEGLVPYQGSLHDIVEQWRIGIEKGMFNTGSRNIAELMERANFTRVSPGAQVESHPHDMTITREPRNYSTS